MQISLSGQTGQAYVLDASADLVNWIPLVTNSLAAPGGSFADPIPAGTAWRFYRIDPSNP
jgi:hypothetical protein